MPDRVVSLAPSATEIIRSLDCADRLVGATVHGDHDTSVVGGWLNPDLDRIDALAPDLLVTTDALQSEIVTDLSERGYRTLHLTPRRLPEVMTSIERLGVAMDVADQANRVTAGMRRAIDRLRVDPADGPRPTVYCEEWSSPPMAAGNWVPELVEIAGGRYPFRAPGDRSQEVAQATVERHRPDYVFLHVCGKGRAVEPDVVMDRAWAIPAIDRGNVAVIDDRLLNQPAPTLVEGLRAMRTELLDHTDLLDAAPDAD